MIKIYTRRDPQSINVDIFIVSEPGAGALKRHGDIFGYWQLNEKGQALVTNVHYKMGEPMQFKPAFTIPEMDFRDMMQAFIDLAKENGVVNPSESVGNAKFEVQSRHLDDLRKLLKLDDKANS